MGDGKELILACVVGWLRHVRRGKHVARIRRDVVRDDRVATQGVAPPGPLCQDLDARVQLQHKASFRHGVSRRSDRPGPHLTARRRTRLLRRRALLCRPSWRLLSTGGETESRADTSHPVHERPHARDDCHLSTAVPPLATFGESRLVTAMMRAAIAARA